MFLFYQQLMYDEFMQTFFNKMMTDQTFFLSVAITIGIIISKLVSGEQISETDFGSLLVGASSPAVRANKSRARKENKKPSGFLNTDGEI